MDTSDNKSQPNFTFIQMDPKNTRGVPLVPSSRPDSPNTASSIWPQQYGAPTTLPTYSSTPSSTVPSASLSGSHMYIKTNTAGTYTPHTYPNSHNYANSTQVNHNSTINVPDRNNGLYANILSDKSNPSANYNSFQYFTPTYPMNYYNRQDYPQYNSDSSKRKIEDDSSQQVIKRKRVESIHYPHPKDFKFESNSEDTAEPKIITGEDVDDEWELEQESKKWRLCITPTIKKTKSRTKSSDIDLGIEKSEKEE
eukprot:TRINITY_DN11667_c0_g1_i1.p1 TRINITY_DN11667_c0_g1~~TRINITY_DN11667_c0_g1_i1.p1  ORF type:complete len:253 (-),score=46.76 TRINITY_DN11667_c0_g1_i1:54-812(-)